MKQIDYTALTQPTSIRQALKYKLDNMSVRQKLVWLVAGIILAIVGVIVIATTIGSFGSGDVNLGPFILLLSVTFFLLVAVNIVASKIQVALKVSRFAEDNGFRSISNVPNPAYRGVIFNQETARLVTFAVIIPHEAGREIEFGEYQYTDANGKYSRINKYGYIKVKLNQRLPHIMLVSKKNSANHNFLSAQKLLLEGDFNNYFDVFVPTGYERDALYILKPDLMATLIDNAKDYSIEIIDDELYVYKFGTWFLATPGVLQNLQTLMTKILKEVDEETVRYVDARVENNTEKIISEQGRNLKRHNTMWLTLLSVIVGLILGYIIITSRASQP